MKPFSLCRWLSLLTGIPLEGEGEKKREIEEDGKRQIEREIEKRAE